MTDQTALRKQNMRALGPNANQRIDTVAVWLGARGGARGQEMANLLRQYPAAALVEGYEQIIRSVQGGTPNFQQPPQTQEAPGKSFIEQRVTQMMQRMQQPGYRGR